MTVRWGRKSVLTSRAGAATVQHDTRRRTVTDGTRPAVVADPAGQLVKTVEELAARWHRHKRDPADFSAGMRTGWAQAIALCLDAPLADVKEALEEGNL